MSELQRTGSKIAYPLQEPFFESLLREALRVGLMNETELTRIQGEFGTLLAAQAQRYTHGESSSIKTEAALSLLQSVFYGIGLHLKSLPDAETAVAALKEQSLSDLFHSGLTRIKEDFLRAKQRYAEVLAGRITTANLAYNDTLDTGIPVFFRDYDREFGAHETPGMIDYPVGGPPIQTTGIAYMEDYLGRLHAENTFCQPFTPEQIHSVLFCHHPGYADLLINIGELVRERLLPDGTLPELQAEAPLQPVIVFEDGKKMDDDLFRTLSEELRSCRFVSDKLHLLNEYPHSFSDLLNLLDASCFWDSECSVLFSALEEIELALLFRHVTEKSERDTNRDGAQPAWQSEFDRWLNRAEAQRKLRIEVLSQNISQNTEGDRAQ